MIAVLAVGGFTCAEIGRRLPFLSWPGAAAMFATFFPSWLTCAHLLPASAASAIKHFTKERQFLYLYVAAIIVGSVLSMDRQVLLCGLIKSSRRFW